MEPPRPPDDIEMKNIIDKLAQFVARNGPEFERMTKSKQENNPRFAFLWGGPFFNYYTYKVTTEQTLLRHKQNQQDNSGPRPLMEIDVSGARPNNQGFGGPGWGQPQPQPEPPRTDHITDQIANLQNSQATLRDQIKQSELNLSAQWTVLQQNNEVLALEQIVKSQENDLEDLSRSTNISLSIFDSVLQPIIETCTKDAISSGKSWIFQNSNNSECNRLMASYLNFKVTSTNADFTTKLHIIYLVNDVLHHCVRKNNLELKAAFEKVAVSMYSAAASIANEDQMPKLSKLVTLWETKSKFFDENILDGMKNYQDSFEKYKENLKKCYAVEIQGATEPGTQTYEGYKAQHEQFVGHAENQILQYGTEIEGLQLQLRNIEASHQQKMLEWQQQQQLQGGMGVANRKSRWDSTAPIGGNNGGSMQPGLPVADMSRPPPGFMGQGETMPSAPYYDLPAGLMVPLIKFEDSEYKPLDPDLIRLPPPQPPSERLMAAVEYFYSAPSHDRPRDPDGWERLALYEWGREKQYAIKKKEDDIAAGRRQRSATLSPTSSRESTPDQTVPSEQPRRRGYRSRSRTRSRSRGSTPPRKSTKSLRKRSRSASRSRTRSRSRSRTPNRSRGRSRTRSGSRETPPRHLKRSPSPRSSYSDDRLSDSNKGHQMLQKMGWKGTGLGSQESGILDPVSGGEVRDKMDQYRGMGTPGADPFESFRKQRAGAFRSRMMNKAEEKKGSRRPEDDD